MLSQKEDITIRIMLSEWMTAIYKCRGGGLRTYDIVNLPPMYLYLPQLSTQVPS